MTKCCESNLFFIKDTLKSSDRYLEHDKERKRKIELRQQENISKLEQYRIEEEKRAEEKRKREEEERRLKELKAEENSRKIEEIARDWEKEHKDKEADKQSKKKGRSKNKKKDDDFLVQENEDHIDHLCKYLRADGFG
jgi:septal ring factor EnvC (AmiA/AmiB activator)